MGDTTQFTIGAEVSCRDGEAGRLRRVVIDPVERSITHLVIEPEHGQGLDRLVPVQLVEVSADGVRLACSLAEFHELPAAEETRFLPGNGAFGYGADQALSWPYYGLGLNGVGMAGGGLAGTNLPVAATYETVPAGEVAIHRGDRVHATDGSIGRVQGLVMAEGHQVTHILLQEGHLWGRKEVAIPMGAVSAVEADGIQLNISKQVVQDLPPVEFADPAAPQE